MLPPLRALVAFEAVARLGSIGAAARELCVTQAAVSQQLKSLETFLACHPSIKNILLSGSIFSWWTGHQPTLVRMSISS
nr:LysR family transcriptional regulator [Vibrio sp. Isolate34]